MTDAEPAPKLEATGERLIPEAYAGELVLAEHLARYRLAARLAPGRRVLDAGCGEGYGTAMLTAAGAASVVGVDVDEQTAAHARQRYGLDVRVGDVAQLPLGDREFDLVVSFETIEHVREPEAALSEFARVLAPGGLLMVSTPNASEYLVDNPFHERELTTAEFFAALEARFPAVRPLYQQNFLTSVVLDAERLARDDGSTWEALEAAKVAGVPPGRELYTLALCGFGELPPLDANVGVLSDVYEAHEMVARMVETDRDRRAWKERALLAERIQADWEQRATTAEANQRAWEERAKEAERQNAEHEATIERIAASLSWRITKPLRSLKGRGR